MIVGEAGFQQTKAASQQLCPAPSVPKRQSRVGAACRGRAENQRDTDARFFGDSRKGVDMEPTSYEFTSDIGTAYAVCGIAVREPGAEGIDGYFQPGDSNFLAALAVFNQMVAAEQPL